MKKKLLKTWTQRGSLLLIVLFYFLTSFVLHAQSQNIPPAFDGSVVGTDNSRLVATVEEKGQNVTIKVFVVGEVLADVLDFGFFYNPNNLSLTDRTFTATIPFQEDYGANQTTIKQAMDIDPVFVNKGFLYGILEHRETGSSINNPSISSVAGMNMFMGAMITPSGNKADMIVATAGQAIPVFKAYLKKTSNTPLQITDLGFGVKATSTGATSSGGYYTPFWGYPGVIVGYVENISGDETITPRPDLFYFRSPSTVTTLSASNISAFTAVLNGTFARGANNLPEVTDMLDGRILPSTIYNYTGKLGWDDVVNYGYFYSTSTATIVVNEFSNQLIIDGTPENFPNTTELAAGEFIRNGKTFYIKWNSNGSTDRLVPNPNVEITGLTPNTTYHAWAVMQYKFQTSNQYYAVDSMTTFSTIQDACPIVNINTIFAATEPTCGNSNGSIQVYATGGSGVYEYSVNGGTFTAYAGGLITGLAAGTYQITVRDANRPECEGATAGNIVLHNSGTDLAVSMSSGDASSCTNPDGTLYVSVSGGVAPYTYTLNGVTITVTDGMIVNQPAGVYVLKVTDAANCVASSGEVRLNSSASTFAVAFSNTVNTVCGSSTGSITFTVSGATGYTYQLDGHPEVLETVNATTVLNGLSAGIHTLRVSDACNEVVEEFTITNGDGELFFTATTVNEMLSCTNSLIPGSITLNVSNGTPGYQYRIDGGAWLDFPASSSTVTLSGLHSGIYKVEVRDNDTDTCKYEMNNITILRESYTPINIGTVFAATEPTCGNSDGSIQVYATGGSGTYKYSVNGGAFTAYAGGLITGLSAGTYTITVQDAAQPLCPDATVGNIVLHNSKTDLLVSMSSDEASSCTHPDGTLYVSVSGGEAPYTYTLNGVAITVTDGMIANQPAGVYVLNVTDASNCVASSGEVRINSSASTLAVAVNNTVNTVCGSSTGSITFTVSGSTGYTYQIDGHPEVSSTVNTPIVINGLGAGVHTLRVTDYCGEIVKEITITNGDDALAFTANTINEMLSCAGDLLAGSIKLFVSNGAGGYQYRIDGGAWINFPASSSTATISDLHSGIYRVEVRDVNGCAYEMNHITILRETYSLINIGTIFAATDPTCGNSDGSIQVYATGGSGTYEYSVNGGSFTSYANGLITNLAAGTYKITVRDAAQPLCPEATVSDIVLHNSKTDLVISVTSGDASSCTEPDGTLYVSVSGGVAPYTYTLNGVAVTVTDGMILNQPVGVYVINVKDASNCVSSSGEVRINSSASTLAVALSDVVNTVCGSSTGSITFTVSGSTGYTYQLDGHPEVQETVNTPIVLHGLSAGVHTLRVTDYCGEVVKEITITNGDNALAFTTTTVNEVIICNGDVVGGSINLFVSNGAGGYQYRVDGGAWLNFPAGSSTATISDLHSGIYRVEVRDVNGCAYEVNNVKVDRKIWDAVSAPSATTPQIFCSNATVANLQATGANIKWYDEDGNLLTANTPLEDGKVYYASQTLGICESTTLTAVKVVIDDYVVLEPPHIDSPQAFCSPATIADIVTDGNTNLVWYDDPIAGNLLSLSTPLADGVSVYAAQSAGGTCQSAVRTEVEIAITTTPPNAPAITSPQHFCEGALIANITVPNNQIVWYDQPTGGTLYASSTLLEDGKIYYAAQKAGACESTSRTPVQIILDAPQAPYAPETQGFCFGLTTATLADIKITGAGIVWYDAPTGGNKLSLDTQLEEGKTYYAAQAIGTCEGARTAVTITTECYVVQGTVFPFVHENDAAFNALFPVFVKLYSVPPVDIDDDPINYMWTNGPVYTTQAIYYDATVTYVPGTPKNPGQIGKTNNPGLPINWSLLDKTPEAQDNTPVTGPNDQPTSPVGVYTLQGVAPGAYVLEITRQGYLTRWAEVTISEDMTLGHREILAGDVNGDLRVNERDASTIKSKYSNYGFPLYDPKFDLNGDKFVNSENDLHLILFNFGATMRIYQETRQWLNQY